jgi:two-component system, NarL family, nitrate/nitrite response regulator NarL
MDTMIQIAAIDNDRMLLEGMAAWIATAGDIDLAEMASSVSEYLASDARAPVVLLDLNLEDFSDPAANVQMLVDAGKRVIVMSVIPDKVHIINVSQAGAAAYITKDHNLSALADVIRRVFRGDPTLTTEHAFWLSQDTRANRPQLSPQELRILQLYASGMALKSAAKRVGVAYGTARTYLARVQAKYAEAGRPINNRVDYAVRLREDQFGRERLGEHGCDKEAQS